MKNHAIIHVKEEKKIYIYILMPLENVLWVSLGSIAAIKDECQNC